MNNNQPKKQTVATTGERNIAGTTKAEVVESTPKKVNLPLGKQNYVLIAISFVLVIVGFMLMLGSGSTDDTFNPDIFSTRRIVVAPTIAFIGFVCMIFAILRKPRN